MKLIDKDAALAMIEELESQNNCGTDDFIESKRIAYKQVKNGVLEMQEIVSMQEEPVSEDLEKEMQHYFCKEWAGDPVVAARHFAAWQKEQMMKNTADAMIGLPYENKDGGYTHLVDVSRPLPVGNNKIAIIFKED